MTTYKEVFDKFVKRLKNDDDFLAYKNISEEEVEDLVKDHCVDLLNQAIGKIYDIGKPDVDFYDKDDKNETFNVVLFNQEIKLLVDLMYECYRAEDRNKMHFYELTFTSNELNVFSPAANRDSFLKMLNSIENTNMRNINNYLSRDRKTWKIKSIYK